MGGGEQEQAYSCSFSLVLLDNLQNEQVTLLHFIFLQRTFGDKIKMSYGKKKYTYIHIPLIEFNWSEPAVRKTNYQCISSILSSMDFNSLLSYTPVCNVFP